MIAQGCRMHITMVKKRLADGSECRTRAAAAAAAASWSRGVSIDGGASWQSLDGSGPTGIPDIPVHSIVVDPDDQERLYLGTDLGVMVSLDAGQTWMTEETGFGPAVTMWLSLIRTPAGQKQLFAFTHGRGAWRVTLR